MAERIIIGRKEASQFADKDQASRDARRRGATGKSIKLKKAATIHHERFVESFLSKPPKLG
jgi:hypothetical protein